MTANATSRRILLTGAAGNTGRVIAEVLHARGVPCVVMTHSPANRDAFQARGLHAVLGDFDAPDTLRQALHGIDAAYLVCTPDEKLIPRETAFIRAAQQAGVRHIVLCSAYLSGEAAETQNLRSHGVIEKTLRESGLAYTILRPVGFMQTFTQFIWDMVQQADAVSLPAGDGGMALIDVRDVAQVAVKALTEPGHEGQVYDLTGPESLSLHRQAAILSQILGRRITYVPSQEAELARVMAVLGVPATPSEHVLKVFRMQRERRLEVVLPTLRQLGIEPSTYSQFLADYIAGRTRGGNSFQPPDTLPIRLFNWAGLRLLRVRAAHLRWTQARRSPTR